MTSLEQRRKMMDLMETDSSARERILSVSDSFIPLATGDSNVTGAIFKLRSRRYLKTLPQHTHGLPRYVVVKVSPYYVNSDSVTGKFTRSTRPMNRTDPTNIEAHALNMMRCLILTNVCPNICLMYKYFVCKDLPAIAEVAPSKMMSKFSQLASSETPVVRDTAMVIVSEYATLGSLRSVRMSRTMSVDEWRSVLFQTLYTLAVLQDMWEFRHNDLHQANILLEVDSNKEPVIYNFMGKKFYVNKHGLDVRITDLDWSYSPTVLENAKVTRGKSSVDARTPRQFDPHRLFNHTISSDKGEIPTEIKKFIKTLYVDEFFGKESKYIKNYRLRKDCDLRNVPTPIDILMHSFFDPYLVQTRTKRPEVGYDKSIRDKIVGK